MWSATFILSLVGPLALALDCPGLFDWSEYCCKDKALGCFTDDKPYDHLPLPCCYDDEGDVTYSLYTRNNKEKPEFLHVYDESIPSEFDPSRRTVFVSHGFVSGSDNDEFQKMKDAFLDREDMNVVLIDWPSWRVNYDLSASETRTVGKLTSLVMTKLVNEAGANYDDIWCVGHSLGSHVCGFAGKATPQKIGRITGLDPAGPAFEVEAIPFGDKNLKLGLSIDDAQYVDIMHTDTKGSVTTAGFALGTKRRLGNKDFYMNGLEEQPGCLSRKKRSGLDDLAEEIRHSDLLPVCSHMRAPDYFTESIRNDCFIARLKCTDENEMPESCSPCDGDGVCGIMGFASPTTGEDGIFFIETAPEGKYPPHCLG